MIFALRMRAASRLGRARAALADRTFVLRVEEEDAARLTRLGDLEGQTARANARAECLEASLLVSSHDRVPSWGKSEWTARWDPPTTQG